MLNKEFDWSLYLLAVSSFLGGRFQVIVWRFSLEMEEEPPRKHLAQVVSYPASGRLR